MSQNDLVIANQSFPATRSDINSALQALGSLSSGSSAPATTYANMLWYDTANNTLKMRSEANDQWISIGYLDQTADAFRIFDDTQVVNSSGTQTGLLGDQATSAWEAGTSTTESLVSPAKVKAAIEANVGDSPVKAWVNFDGTTGTIRASFNVSSITDNGTGDYTVNFDTALADANYALSVCGGRDFTDLNGALYPNTAPSSSSVRINTYANDTSASRVDGDYVYVIVTR